MKINTQTAPKEGEELDIMTSNPPAIGSQVEIVKGKQAVALGLVTEHTGRNSYKVLVIMSEAN